MHQQRTGRWSLHWSHCTLAVSWKTRSTQLHKSEQHFFGLAWRDTRHPTCGPFDFNFMFKPCAALHLFFTGNWYFYRMQNVRNKLCPKCCFLFCPKYPSIHIWKLCLFTTRSASPAFAIPFQWEKATSSQSSSADPTSGLLWISISSSIRIIKSWGLHFWFIYRPWLDWAVQYLRGRLPSGWNKNAACTQKTGQL